MDIIYLLCVQNSIRSPQKSHQDYFRRLLRSLKFYLLYFAGNGRRFQIGVEFSGETGNAFFFVDVGVGEACLDQKVQGGFFGADRQQMCQEGLFFLS